MNDDKEPRGTEKASLDLSRFMPYRLAVLADDVSDTIAQVYVDRFDLGRNEWRILAWLGGARAIPVAAIGV